MKKILFTGGGSAGHAVPNVALIERLKNRYELFYIGTDKIEKELIAPFKIPYFSIDCPKLERDRFIKNLSIPSRLKKAERECEDIIGKIKPDLIFSKGGYVSVPVVSAGKKLKVPCLAHESDLSAGLATRLNAAKCKKTLTAFPETAEKIKNGKYVGTPIREELFLSDRRKALAKYAFNASKPTLLVFGGGSGSAAINAALRANILPLAKKYNVLHICGKGNIMQNNIAGYVQREYEADMGSAYACADLVVARAGANTLFECIALKKKALFIPLENAATRGDQLANAEYFLNKRLCAVLREKDLNNFYKAVEDAFTNREIAENLKLTPFVNGAENIIKEIEEIIG